MNSLLDIGACEPKCCEVETTVNDKLLNRKRRLEADLAEVNAALDALNQNPEIARVLSLVGRAVRI